MRKLLNILYVTDAESYLKCDGMDVVVFSKNAEVFRIPVINLEGIVAFCYAGASPGLVKLCVENNVSLSFMSPSGRFIARAQGGCRGNVLLRKKQYALSDDIGFSLPLARIFIAGKIQNCRNILRRALRDNGEDPPLASAAELLLRSVRSALEAESPGELLGVEGDAANAYFGVFNRLILRQKDDFVFNGRNRRPPRDEVNVMLSFTYSMLANEVASALECAGFDPYVGFFHTLRPGRISLALDLMEELRAYLCDRTVLSLINRLQITKKDFTRQSGDTVLLSDTGRRKLITAWQEKKKETLTHPFLGEKISVGLLAHAQARLLSGYIRGDIDNYPVFVVK